MPHRNPQRLLDIVEHMSDAVLGIDFEWRFTYFNQRALASMNAGPGSLIGANVFEVFPEFVGTEWERQCRLAMEQRVPVDFQLFYKHNGTWNEVRAYPTEEGIALFYRDITDRRRHEEDLARRISIIRGINSILRTAMSSEADAELGLKCLQVAEDVTGSELGFISQLGDDGVLHDVSESVPGLAELSSRPGSDVALAEPAPVRELRTRVFERGETFFDNGPLGDMPEASAEGHPQVDSFLGVPLKQAGDTTGVIVVANRPGGYSRETADLLEALAPAIAEALQRLRSVQRDRRRAGFERALNEISQAAHSSLDDRMILERAVSDVSQVTGLNAIAVHVRDEGLWSFSYSHGLPEELRAMRLADEQAPMSSRVIESQEPLVLSDTFHDTRANRALIERFDIRSLVGVPLVVRGQPFGVLFAGSIGEQRWISESVVEFLGHVASTLSLALENARLYEAEHRIAETLQQTLLSLPSRVEGVAFAHAYRSAAEAARVGGDFYDIFEVEHNVIGVVIGDVAGKGLEAAALTSLLRNSIRAHSTERDYSVADVLRLTSSLVYKVTPAETFATVFMAFIDCETRSLSYCNAGHTASVIVNDDGAVRRLASNSALLGAFADARFEVDETQLGEDELLLLYTDGIIEARSGKAMYGEDRLMGVVSATGDGEPRSLVKAVIDDVQGFTGGELTDDVAVMAVKLLPKGRTAPTQQEVTV